MNKKTKMFMIISIILVCFFSTLKIVHISGQNEVKKDLVVKDLSDVLIEWFKEVRSTAFKNITVNLSLAEDIQPLKIEDKKILAIFYLNAKMIPKLTLEDVLNSPYLKGMQRYLDENRKKLTAAQINIVESLIKEKYDTLKDIIGKETEENGRFKVECDIISEDKIDKNSAKIFYDISAKGEPIWKDVNDGFIPSKSNLDEEKEGYKEVENLINKLYPKDSLISPNTLYSNYYNRVNAKYYADCYTSEAPYEAYITCWVDNNPEISHYTDLRYWNNSQYPLDILSNGYYEKLACYNCADFVSQAMYYGGMLTDNKWNPSYRKTGAPDGKWYWTYVPHLTDYMEKIRHDWNQISYNNLDVGDVAVFYRNNNERYHVAMVDYSYAYYGVYYNYFAAHTNDVKRHYYNSSSKYFYKVSCWR